MPYYALLLSMFVSNMTSCRRAVRRSAVPAALLLPSSSLPPSVAPLVVQSLFGTTSCPTRTLRARKVPSILYRIPDASNRSDELVVEAVVDLAAQIADVDVDEIGVAQKIAPPDAVEEFVARMYFVAM